MEAKELMIGDWVQIVEPSKYAGAIGCIKTLIDHKDNENAYFKVFLRNNTICIGIEDICSEDIRPIPLTPQLLRRLGFDKKHNYWQLDEGWIITVLDLNCVKPQVNVLIANYNTINKTDYDSGWQDVIYLHELQHAMKLCRIDKKFEL